DDGEGRRDQRFAGDAADRVLGEDRVENGIGNLIGDFVRMSFGDRLGREKMPAPTAHAVRSFEEVRLTPDTTYDLLPLGKRLSLADSRAWMKTIVHRPKTRFQHVRVDLGRRMICVSEHQLNRAQIGS